MRNQEKWKETKYVLEKGRLVGSRDRNEVSVGSILMTNLIANCYERNLRHHAKGKLLDLGCGKVPLYAAYRDFVSDNICVDWANTLHPNQHLDYEFDLSKTLPFENGVFDTIILSDVLEHIPAPDQLWGEMARILSREGKVIINVPFYYWIHEQPHDYYRYTEFALRRFVESSGLRLTQLEPIGGAPEIIADILAKNVLRVSHIGRPLSRLIQSLALSFINTKFGKRASKATSKDFPFGYFLIAEKTV